MKGKVPVLVPTTSGTLLGLGAGFWTQDVLHTVILAVVGAAVSFVVTLLLQQWFKPR